MQRHIYSNIHSTGCSTNPQWRGGSIGRASNSRSKGPRFDFHQEHKKNLWLFTESKMLCWLAVGVPNPHVYKHAQEWSRTHIKDPVVHVRVRRITETQKDPACTLLLTGGEMYFCTVNENSRVMICTLKQCPLAAGFNAFSPCGALSQFGKNEIKAPINTIQYFCTVNENSRVMICTLKQRPLAAGFNAFSPCGAFSRLGKIEIKAPINTNTTQCISPRQIFWWVCLDGRAWCPGTPSTSAWRTPGSAGLAPPVCRVPAPAGSWPHFPPDTASLWGTAQAPLPEYPSALCSLDLEVDVIQNVLVLPMVKQFVITDQCLFVSLLNV